MMRASGGDIAVIDVREPWELKLAALDDAWPIPMNEVPARVDELAPDKTTVVVCHHGNRSRTVCRFLDQQGFRDVVNLEGGIDAWSQEVDDNVPQY